MNGMSSGKTARDERPMDSRRTLARLFRYMSDVKLQLLGLTAVIALSIGCELVIPLLVEEAIDSISIFGGLLINLNRLKRALLLLTGVILANGLLGFLQGRVSAVISLNVENRMRQELMAKYLYLSVSDSERFPQGELMSRALNDTRLAAQTFTEAVLSVGASLAVIIGCAVIMFTKSVLLAAVSVGAALLGVVGTGLLSNVLFPRVRDRQRALGDLNAHVEESLRAYRTCTTAGRLDYNQEKLEAENRKLYEKRMHANRMEGILQPLMVLLGNLNFLLIVLVGGRAILTGSLTVGAMQAFILYSRQFMEPVNGLGECFVQLQNALAGGERVFQILDMPSEDAGSGSEMQKCSGQIEFTDVGFGYRRNLPVLKGLNLTVRPGEHIAVIGRTGVGKTTLVNLLLRFYSGYTGSIRLDGQELRELGLRTLRGSVTFVSQEPHILSGTVRENLTYGAPEASMEQIRQAAETVGIHSLIEELPQGYDTVLGSTGQELSQGQQQLICLARALLRDPGILILDEATSSVDPETEAMLKSGIRSLMQGRTCITIAHRLASIRDADRIAVIQDGVVAELGTFDELMHQNIAGELFRSQYTGKEI